jgi:enoyl-CoA hydratase
MSDGGRITTRVDGRVLVIGIDRAKKRNAFSVKMYKELSLAYARLADDDELWAGVLYAEGDHFTGGLDLGEFAAEFSEGRLPYPEGSVDPMRLTGRPLDKPVVAAVQGICYTVGLELMLGTDIRVASDDVRFGQIEVKRGIYPVGGATIRFVREAGWGNAMRYLLTGDLFDAQEALRLGFVQEVVPAGQALDRALELAHTICRQAPLGVRACMRSSRCFAVEGEEAAVARLLPDLMPIMNSEDVQEGVMSFMERREAEFKGK